MNSKQLKAMVRCTNWFSASFNFSWLMDIFMRRMSGGGAGEVTNLQYRKIKS